MSILPTKLTQLIETPTQLIETSTQVTDDSCSVGSICDSLDSLQVVQVKQHFCRLPGGGSTKKCARKSVAFKKNVPAKKKTHIKEGKQRAKLSNKPKMDPDTFRAYIMQIDYNKENFRSGQKTGKSMKTM